MANGDPNALNYGSTVIAPSTPNLLQPSSGTWAPSTWQPGQPGTPSSANLANMPMPSSDQINQQRQLITQRLKQYGYPAVNLTDQQVLATMTNIPQGAVQWPSWVQTYFQQNPGSQVGGARPGVDMPYDQTYEPYNLQSRGMGNALTQIGAQYAIPRAALIQHYGQAAVDAMDAQWVRQGSTQSWGGQPVQQDIRTDYR